MDRRTFVSSIALGLIVMPLATDAQQPAMPVIGFLRSTSPADSARLVAAFRQGLSEIGYVDGQNVTIEYHWAEGQHDRLPLMANDLIRRNVAVIAAAGNEALVAARAATATIPIVFAIGDDPVSLGFVRSLSRPGGNVTGVSFQSTELIAKRLELLHELLPRVATIAYLMNPNSAGSESEMREMQAAARAIGLHVLVVKAGSESDIDAAFEGLVRQRVGAVIVGSGAFFLGHRDRLALLAATDAIPAIYDQRGYVMAGGLMCYGASITDVYREVGIYVGRILKGDKPAALPVLQPTKFELVLNLKAAKALGLTIPQSILLRAVEVIQ